MQFKEKGFIIYCYIINILHSKFIYNLIWKVVFI